MPGRLFTLRDAFQIASVLVPISLALFMWKFAIRVPTWMFLGSYAGFQILSGLDKILLILGRFSPRVTLWGVWVEYWLEAGRD